MGCVTFTAPARQDLVEIWQYLEREAGEVVAERVMGQILEAIETVSDQPNIYQQTHYVGAPRRLNVHRYAIFYAVEEGESSLTVWRVVHGVRELSDLIAPPNR